MTYRQGNEFTSDVLLFEEEVCFYEFYLQILIQLWLITIPDIVPIFFVREFIDKTFINSDNILWHMLF